MRSEEHGHSRQANVHDLYTTGMKYEPCYDSNSGRRPLGSGAYLKSASPAASRCYHVIAIRGTRLAMRALKNVYGR